jgi:hypothetical protein
VNYLQHHSRVALLRGMTPGAQRLLSAGCGGTWHFDWIEETYGHVPEHLGIEYYASKPDQLPDNVTWIANTVSDMSAVADASCDLVFSGQNLERLWAEEMSGFLLEAARVVRLGGHLVVDSPPEPLNCELKRWTDVVGIFPNRDAVVWLVDAVLAEQHDEWAVGRRYATVDALLRRAPVSLPAPDPNEPKSKRAT